MPLVTCHECLSEISTTAKACPSCGALQKKDGFPWVKIIIAIPAAFVVAVLASNAISPDPQSDEKYNKRAAIKMCWEDWEKKSNPPGLSRLIASACEKMEDDFTSKYRIRP